MHAHLGVVRYDLKALNARVISRRVRVSSRQLDLSGELHPVSCMLAENSQRWESERLKRIILIADVAVVNNLSNCTRAIR
jgi:uncharacterized SAM-dependent methyltransferase